MAGMHMAQDRIAKRLHWRLLALILLVMESCCLLCSLLFCTLVSPPCLSKLFEFCWEALGPVLLHIDVSVEVVESTVSLLAIAPVADVESLNLVKSTARSLLGIHARERYERVHFRTVHATIGTGHITAILGPGHWVHGLGVLLSVMRMGYLSLRLWMGVKGMLLKRERIHVSHHRRGSGHSLDWNRVRSDESTVLCERAIHGA